MIRSPAAPRHGFTLLELLVVIAIIGFFVAMLLPAVQAAREAARYTQCKNNLRQIGLVTQLFTDSEGHLPPPAAGDGNQYDDQGSFFVLLLPYLEEASLYASFDPTQTIGHPSNLPVTTKTVSTYLCPSMQLVEPQAGNDAQPYGAGSYIISTRTRFGLQKHLREYDGSFDVIDERPSILRLREFPDGLSKTLLAGETTSGLAGEEGGVAFAWAPGYWAIAFGQMALDPNKSGVLIGAKTFNNPGEWIYPLSTSTYRSDHAGGVNFVLLDGSVRFVATDSDPEIRRALVTRAGQEPIDTTDL